jgi:hypothetical protein
MRDLAAALTESLREIRTTITVDSKTGAALAELMEMVVHVSPRSTRPLKLAEAAAACLQLLDEILATEFTLIMDPEAYAPLAVISRWWQPSSYPPLVTDTLVGLIRKLTSAISFRARLGQRSETLALRLRQALGASDGSATDVLLNIAETETGLAPEIDDWLRGRERASSSTSAALGSLLSGTGVAEIAQAIAPILLECVEATKTAASSSDPQLATDVRRITARVQALAAELKLAILEKGYERDGQ